MTRRLARGIAFSGCVAVAVASGCGNDSDSATPNESPAYTSIETAPNDSASGGPAFTVVAQGRNYSDPDAEPTVVASGDVAAAWAERAETPMPELSSGVAIVVDAGGGYRNTIVTAVVGTDDEWTIQLTGNHAAECAGSDVVLAESHLVVVDVDATDEFVAAIQVDPGC